MTKKFLYFYYTTPESFRKIYLIPKNNLAFEKRKISDLEGLFISNIGVAREDLTFPISKIEEMKRKYNGALVPFDSYN